MGKNIPPQLRTRRLVMLFLPVVLAVLLAWFYLPRVGVTPERVAKVHAGMTHEEVQELLGVPDDTTMYTGSIERVAVSTETWVYRVGEKRLTLKFSGGRVRGVEKVGF